jgi:drug/metabolite transporter (DMT)-like permease
MTMLGSVAALFLKRASIFHSIINLIKNGNVYIGAVLYTISAVINIYVLRYLDYSVVLPLTSLTYIWTLLLARFFLKETFTIRKFAGIAGILIGTFIISI